MRSRGPSSLTGTSAWLLQTVSMAEHEPRQDCQAGGGGGSHPNLSRKLAVVHGPPRMGFLCPNVAGGHGRPAGLSQVRDVEPP